MSADLLRPIRWLDAVDTHGHAVRAPVCVVPMTDRLATRWHTQVQPLVDSLYGASSKVDGLTRADAGWNWRWLRRLAAMHTTMSLLPGVRSGEALAFSLVIETSAQDQFPIGMLTCVPRFHSLALDERRHRALAWCLADAPKEAYEQMDGVPRVKGVAQALVDCAIQAALDLGEPGSLLLHADPAGGHRLRRFYQQDCLMEPLPSSAPAVSWMRRHHPTDEYFHFNDTQADRFTRQFESKRIHC